MEIPPQLGSQLSTLLKTYLKENHLDLALQVINDNKYSEILKENCSDLFPVISEYLTESTQLTNPELYELCKDLLNTVALKSNPYDVLHELINLFETCKDDMTFLSILPAHRICWKLVPKNRLNTLAWTINAMYLYIENIYDTKDDTDEDTDLRLFKLCEAFTDFCLKVFEDMPKDSASIENKKKKNYLVEFMVKLIGKPIGRLNTNNLPTSGYKKLVNDLLNLLKILLGDIYSILNDFVCDTTFLAVVYYLLFIESNQFEGIYVYNKNYIVRNMIFLSSVLIKHDDQFLIAKGLHLSQYVLNLVTSISDQELEGNVYNQYFLSLSQVVVYNGLENIRKSALANISNGILKFDTKGQYLLLQNFLPQISHSGLKGYICTIYKDMLRDVFDSKQTFPIYLKGKKLLSILKIFITLPSGAATDLLDLADQIIAALNTLRFLILRDKCNQTEIWNHIAVIQETFLNPLREGLKMSKAHYEIKLKELNDEKKVTKDDVEFEVLIGNEKLSESPISDKIAAVHSSLNAFHVMESLMIYLEESITEDQKHKIK